jgi:hypothetical protein
LTVTLIISQLTIWARVGLLGEFGEIDAVRL